MFEKSCQIGKVPSDWIKGVSHSFLKRIIRRTLDNTHQPASPLCPLRTQDRSCWKMHQNIWKTGKWSETVTMASPRANHARLIQVALSEPLIFGVFSRFWMQVLILNGCYLSFRMNLHITDLFDHFSNMKVTC